MHQEHPKIEIGILGFDMQLIMAKKALNFNLILQPSKLFVKVLGN